MDNSRIEKAVETFIREVETLESCYRHQKQLAGDRMLVIGMIASALDIEDLESAHRDPAVILQAIEKLKGTSNEETNSN